MERLRIVINFKNTSEDIDLYNKLKKRSCMSGYIKDVLKGLEDNDINIQSEDTSNRNEDNIADDIADILF